ncbi:ATP-binding protein [Streptomyces caniferus]|uniref:HD domain-containing protein n=1 Tax=Streptomyces caniferus TaxID=285557 RepID=UPI002E28F616|nr:ATP-binding protein [Streptomyces caniferus]
MHIDGRTAAGLWKRAFSPDSFTESATERDRFSSALHDMRTRGAHLAVEISADMPDFTQHDVTHMDSLWELADLVAGPHTTLNPAEAFVFGGAVIVHDLAMSRAAHSLLGGVRSRADWPDALASELRFQLRRSPHPSELAMPPEEIAARAEKILFRRAHAELAESLPLTSWKSLSGDTMYLISDPEIRIAYGRLIGEIAASHHWNYEKVTERLSAPVGAPGFAPVSWKVDSLYLACLLRTADASHLDATRSPDILAAVREISSDSRDHWIFQSRLQRPYLQNEKLCFTAPAGFSREEMSAWWLAYDTLKMVDGELKSADTLLLASGRTPFQVRGVANVQSPSAFSSIAGCHDWEPIEARVKVGDVANLVRRLGGKELYGQDWTIGLREILANACDAVKAREALAEYRGGRRVVGRVTISVEVTEDQVWLSCHDNGIGMTSGVMGHQLLDFGCSSWLSPDTAKSTPGLIASKFEPTGKFGIGFFSVFMLGERVQVISRSLSEGPSETWILEFSSGVNKRPTLRKAAQSEQLDEPGTSVRVALDASIYAQSENSVAFRFKTHGSAFTTEGFASISDIIAYAMPAAECDLWVEEAGVPAEASPVIAKNDWVTVDGYRFLCRVLGIPEKALTDKDADPYSTLRDFAEQHKDDLSVIRDSSGLPAGRLCMVPESTRSGFYSARDSSFVTAGPARTSTRVYAAAGIAIGRPSRAARDSAIPILEPAEMAKWATREAVRLAERIAAGTLEAGDWCIDAAEQILQFGGDVGFPFWRTSQGWLTQDQLVSWMKGRTVLFVTHPVFADVRVGRTDIPASLEEGIVVYEWSHRDALWGVKDWPAVNNEYRGCTGALLRAIAEAWDVVISRVVEASAKREQEFVIGRHEGNEMRGECTVFSRSDLERT